MSCKSNSYVVLRIDEDPRFIQVEINQLDNMFKDEGVLFYSRKNCYRCEISKNQVLLPYMIEKRVSFYEISLDEIENQNEIIDFNKKYNIYLNYVPHLIIFQKYNVIVQENDYNRFVKILNNYCIIK